MCGTQLHNHLLLRHQASASHYPSYAIMRAAFHPSALLEQSRQSIDSRLPASATIGSCRDILDATRCDPTGAKNYTTVGPKQVGQQRSIPKSTFLRHQQEGRQEGRQKETEGRQDGHNQQEGRQGGHNDQQEGKREPLTVNCLGKKETEGKQDGHSDQQEGRQDSRQRETRRETRRTQ